KDWEAEKEQMLKHAQSVLFEAGNKMTGKLLEDHKREQEADRKQREEQARKITENVMKEFKTLSERVASLHTNVALSDGRVAQMWKALTVPSEAGRFAEIGLENSLKAFGLEAGRDFIMQYAVRTGSGRSLRPDAILFLPDERVMIIDSKA